MSSSPRNTYMVMIAGALVVVALVVWALNRSLNAPVSSQTPVVAGTAAPAPPPPVQTQDAEHAAVPRISVDDLRQKLERGEVTVIDVRDADSYIASHIAGSLHIPLARIEGEIPYLPKDKRIVTYCT